ncbi:MAG: hypothetical protein WCE94_10780 [Candidatus Methanoperedens sp.]
MHYQVDLQKLVSKALNEEEIQKGVQLANIEKEFLTSQILKKSSEILEAGAKEVEELNKLEDELQFVDDEILHKTPAIVVFLRKFKNYFIGSLVLIVIGYFVSIYLVDISIVFKWLSLYLPSIFTIVVVIEIILFMLYQLYLRDYDRNIYIMMKNLGILGIDELKKRNELAKQSVEKAVLEKGILPELRLIINKQLAPSYDTILTPLMSPGLAEFFDPEYEIPTEPKANLNRLFDIMPNGSIGIAGPRGAGKTTLMLSFCRPSENKIKDSPVLSVMTSAPVEYKARDFILHIFSIVCMRVLSLKNKRPQSTWGYINTLQKPSFNPFISLLWFLQTPTIISIFIVIGLILILLSRYISTLYTMFLSLGFEPKFFLWGLFSIGMGFLLFFGHSGFLNRHYKEREYFEERYRSSYDREGSDDIVNEAQEWLKMIRFQSSYSSGWSGSLKIPIGIEGGMNGATSLSENQLSLPEIIDKYRKFIEKVSEKYLVIIGIDELDKLPSDEKAYLFLNEIKGLFGLKNCFYLISVSESAISNFNRRGLPFRDVFDSSFDDMIYVDYLSLEEAKILIKRRVIGMPIPFVSFCYCLSGGLARDLIRTCRNLLELTQKTPEGKNLAILCSSLIRTDIKSKLRAVSAAAKDIKLEPESTKLLENIQNIESSLESPHYLLKCCSDLLFNVTNISISAQQHGSEEVLVKRNKLASLRDELGSYLYYIVTIFEYFDKYIDVESFKEDKGSREIEQLARARQSLEISPTITRSIITDFRKSHKMKIFPHR